jgi:integrase
VRIKAVFGEMAPRDVTSKDVRMFRDKVGQRVGLDWKKPQLAKKALRVLSHLFTTAAEWHVVEANPCRGVKRPPQPRRTRYPSDAEFAAVRRHCAPMVQAAMDIALLTGLRRGDILKLTRDSITDAGLRVETSKTDKALLFAMTDELKAALDRALAMQPKVWRFVICNKQGRAYSGHGFALEPCKTESVEGQKPCHVVRVQRHSRQERERR